MDSSVFEFGQTLSCKKELQSKINTRLANSVDLDETACYDPFHMDLHWLQKYLYWLQR